MERKVAVTNLEHENSTEMEEEFKKDTIGKDVGKMAPEGEGFVPEPDTPIEDIEKEPANIDETEDADIPEESVAQEKEIEEEPEEDGAEADPDSEDVEGELAEVDEVNTTDEEENTEETPLSFYENIIEKAEELVTQSDWAFVTNELAHLALRLEEGPDSSDEEIKTLINKFSDIRARFEERKREHYEEVNKKKEENLVAKKELLKNLSDLINNEKWSATKEVSQIHHKWETIKFIPQNEVDLLNERFNALIEEFESHKVDRLVKKLQKEEENLTLKLLLLDKMDAINVNISNPDADFEYYDKAIHDLILQWRKVGRVPIEKNEEIWAHFNKVQDTFNELRFKYDANYRKSIEKSLSRKKKLISEAEALIDEPDIADAARRVNKLHNVWKKTGNLPQKDENELWNQFKAATDAFNEKKATNLDLLRDQEQHNLAAKLKLIEKAEAIKEVESFEEGHQAMQELMNEWKKIGPVPRKKSSKIWKQFKDAMDAFYEERRSHFKDVRKDQKQNLALKNEIIEKLKALAEHEDAAAAVEEAKVLQQEFKEIGHVPLKAKNKIWKDYREACDVIYNNYRTAGSNLGLERKLAMQGVDSASRKQVINHQKEIDHLKKDIARIESEIIQYKEAQTYFKPTSKGNVLKEELQNKIEKAEDIVSNKRERLHELNQLVSELKG